MNDIYQYTMSYQFVWNSAFAICSLEANASISDYNILKCTVNSRYLELGYLEFCETQSVYLIQKYIFIAFFNLNLALDTFLQVQITRSAN